MSKEATLIADALLERDVVLVEEDGTMDPFNAYYVDGKLVVTNPRGDVSNMLEALGIKPRVLLLPKGFDGNFPPLLNQLKGSKPLR